jgi:hypothetical protein
LKGLKNLKKLYVWQTKVTDAGVAGLRKSLPGVYVNHGEELAITTQPAQPIPEAKVAAATPAAAPAAPTPAPAPKPKAVAAPAAVAAAPTKPPVAAAAPEISLEQTLADTKAAIDAQANAAKAQIDAQAAAAKAAIDAKYLGAKSQAKPQSAGVKPINTKCPLSGEAVNPLRTVVFEGKVIGLCCEKCQAKFAADPKKYIDKVVADAK